MVRATRASRDTDRDVDLSPHQGHEEIIEHDLPAWLAQGPLSGAGLKRAAGAKVKKAVKAKSAAAKKPAATSRKSKRSRR
jgi:hypothetical protein